MAYWQLFYHIVWSTKYRQKIITPEIEPIVHNHLRAKAIGLGGTVFALNGTDDHVHIISSIPPKIAVATFIGQIKAVASTKLNQSGLLSEKFYWQEKYGVFSFDRKRLPNFIAYVERQKEHHANQTTIPILERDNEGNVQLLRENKLLYLTENAQWRAELESF